MYTKDVRAGGLCLLLPPNENALAVVDRLINSAIRLAGRVAMFSIAPPRALTATTLQWLLYAY